MPEELSPQAENDLHELGWYKVGLSIENVKFIIQETLKYPEDPARIRVLIEQGIKGTVLGTVKVVEEEAEPNLVPMESLRARPRRTAWVVPEPLASIAAHDARDTSSIFFVPNTVEVYSYTDLRLNNSNGTTSNVLSPREE